MSRHGRRKAIERRKVARFIPVPKGVEVELKFSLNDGEFAENKFGVLYAAEPTTDQLHEICQKVMDWWHNGDGAGASYREFQSVGCTMTGASARALTVQNDHRVDVAADETSNTGSDSGGALQNGLSFAVTARTGLAGRSYRGRTFLAGLSLSVCVNDGDNVIRASTAGNIVIAFNHLITAVASADTSPTLCVISRYTNNAPRETGIATPVINYGYHDLYLDFQRRRAPGHNVHRRHRR